LPWENYFIHTDQTKEPSQIKSQLPLKKSKYIVSTYICVFQNATTSKTVLYAFQHFYLHCVLCYSTNIQSNIFISKYRRVQMTFVGSKDTKNLLKKHENLTLT